MSKTVPFQTILFSISTQFNIKTVLFHVIQFCLRLYPVLPLRDRDDLKSMAMKGSLHSQKLHPHWNLTIRFFNVMSRTLVGWSYPSAWEQLVQSSVQTDWANLEMSDYS